MPAFVGARELLTGCTSTDSAVVIAEATVQMRAAGGGVWDDKERSGGDTPTALSTRISVRKAGTTLAKKQKKKAIMRTRRKRQSSNKYCFTKNTPQ
jgi:hypothetical protein